MIDSLEMMLPVIDKSDAPARLGLEKGGYTVVTLHRPANVDALDSLTAVVDTLKAVAARTKCVFPVHPRTRKSLENHGLWDGLENTAGMKLLAPQSYVDFMALVVGGQLGDHRLRRHPGGDDLSGHPMPDPAAPTPRGPSPSPRAPTASAIRPTLRALAIELLGRSRPPRPVIEMWDGQTAQRVVASIKEFLGS